MKENRVNAKVMRDLRYIVVKTNWIYLEPTRKFSEKILNIG